MFAAQPDPNAKRWRIATLVAASLVPAALDVLRALGRGVGVDVPATALSTAGVLVLLGVLAVAFDLAMARRVTSTRCFLWMGAVAASAGILESLAALALSKATGFPHIEPAHRTLVVAVRMGAVSGVLGLGLFAMAVALPFAASGAREAERLRTAAELARLRANLQPHFLFNTLSTVAGLVGEDPREARRMIGTLGDLLRDSLVESDDMRSLDDEITWLRHYADILETRHRGSIAFRWEIEEATRKVPIPRLLLQPLVENAVKHGALRRPEGGEVAVRTMLEPREPGRVTCIVEDNGPGPQNGAKRPGGIGLDLVTRRLALRYGKSAEFRLESRDGRTRSVVAIPAEHTP
jgi:hypothetical protein